MSVVLCTRSISRTAGTFRLKHAIRLHSSKIIRQVVTPDISSSTNTPTSTESFITCRQEDGVFISPWPMRSMGAMGALKWSIERMVESDPLIFPSMNGANSHTAIKSVPVQRTKLLSTDQPHVTWIGHATCYFQLEGLSFITDPIFSHTCSPIDGLGPERMVPPAIDLDQLNPDVVLLSHTHYDHLDIPSALSIGNTALWIVPIGVKEILAELGITRCIELNWWERHSVKAPSGREVDVIFTPTKHWTSRTPFDQNSSLWGSFAVKGSKHSFFFSGDTAYCSIFKTIGEHFGPFDMSAISIGAYKPRWFLKDVHCDPDDALRIHLDLRSKQSLAIHWGTFPLSDEDAVEPALELARCRKAANISVNNFFTMGHGETLTFGEKPAHDFATLQPHMLDTYIKYFNKATEKEIKEIVLAEATPIKVTV